MAKRARTAGGAGLGGGTGDIKPQFLTLSSGTMAPNTYDVVQFALPVPRFGTTKTKATVFEILSVDWFLAPEDLTNGIHSDIGYLTTSTNRIDGEPFILNDISIDFGRPQTFAAVIENNIILGANGLLNAVQPLHVDLTDGAGNGMLVATDSIILVVANVSNAVDSVTVAKVKYRLTNIGIAEYVGIVQSQQV